MAEDPNDPNKKDLDLHSSDGLADFFSDVGDDSIDDDYDEIDQLVDEVMALLENYAAYSGGLISYHTIKEYLKGGNHPDLDDEMCNEAVARLRTNKIIEDEVSFEEFPDIRLYIYDGKKIDEEMVSILKMFINRPKINRSDILNEISMDSDKLDGIIRRFIDQRLMTIEDDLYSIPGIPEK